jgi:hypothetical protein
MIGFLLEDEHPANTDNTTTPIISFAKKLTMSFSCLGLVTL